MPLLTRMLPAPLSIDVRRGAFAHLGELLADRRIATEGRVAIAVGPGQGDQIAEHVRPGLRECDVFRVEGASVDAAMSLGSRLRGGSYEAVVGIGGGRTIDATKYAATLAGMPMVSVATNLSHDGICSPVSTLDNDNGRGSYGVPTPIALVIDLDVIHQAPDRYVRSGIGDAISNLSAIADWELSHRETGEPVDGLAAAMARGAGEAVLRHPGTIRDDAFLTTLAEGLVLSGIAMSISGDSRPSSGACHEISHAFDLLYPQRAAAHGEQCGLGAAFAMFLRGAVEESRLMAKVLRRHGLPVLPGEIGFSEEEFVAAVEYAPQTRPGRYTILEHLDLSTEAIRDAYADYAKTISS